MAEGVMDEFLMISNYYPWARYQFVRLVGWLPGLRRSAYRENQIIEAA
jgi:hypothetical protein